ncbi:hypothetical protein RIdsm_04141 [Roseovarius indicus]|uniref:Uncharacterized protein n=1 Tax=Roseovarius indicus TaxID=540747 RepID=A0A5P3AGG8_9RHOB|nr:hypothetical protein RIdsm_04141 [Roseovarius indicus]SFE13059.1 hypothetical protein SAMN04488031_105245 [Roseovarius indicus]
MKKRWMKSVIETSKRATPALPFQRGVRNTTRTAPPLKSVKTA